ncbi:MAG: D-2-hydroxyacid dehydrogenase [Lachnospiraceae bacterium]|nr:D-2-hydroxyacid dehydrogenase [Lachnospiraceae bacterium]
MSEKKRVAVDLKVLDENDRKTLREGAEKLGYEVIFADGDGFEGFEEAEVIYGGPAVLSSGTSLNRLKWFHAMSAGVNNFLEPGVLPEGCLLSGSSGAFGVAVSEHGMMLTLDLVRNMKRYQERVRDRIWSHDLSYNSVCGSRVTLLGTGDIGNNYAKRIKGFDPEIIVGVNRSGKLKENNKDLYDMVVSCDRVESVLPDTDILFMSLPGTEETDRFMDAKRLSLLPENAFIVNVGRGNSIDQKALCDALNNGKIQGAGLDVFEVEPIPQDDPIWETKNLIITTHSAGWLDLDYTRHRNVGLFLENLEAYTEGKDLPSGVDRAVGY